MTRKKVLSPAQVKEARQLHMPHVRGHGYKAIADKFGVGASTVRDAIKFHTYAGIR